ncbi:hypothetical protein [Psychroserpens luteus]|uniref:EF-hand domain-containing protein n=1 Tax=Psychroserpens luteus TaxID=1434066 RepID=A0ABW5ZUZ1_9FLAO|nr:hypothetical protein [Psychroserpens luteus]
MKNYIIILVILISISACTKQDNRKVVDETKDVSEVKKESKTVAIAELPFVIDSTSYMIHLIGNYTTHKRRSEYIGSSGSYSSDDISFTNFSKNRISGNISNVKFQHIDSNELKSLTKNILNIHSMNFLREVYKKTENGYFVYNLTDKDTNADGELDYNDLESLYISNLNGTEFRKLSPNGQDLVTWKTILEANKLYFKTIEDIDGNGEFDKKDKTHYFYLDLNNVGSKVVEYHPI